MQPADYHVLVDVKPEPAEHEERAPCLQPQNKTLGLQNKTPCLQPQTNENMTPGLQPQTNKNMTLYLQPQNNEPVSGVSLQPQNKENKTPGLQLQHGEMRGLQVKKPHFCGVQSLAYRALEIKPTEENQGMYVRQWTRRFTNEPKSLVFDVDGKELTIPADAYGAVNVFDALMAVGVKRTQAQHYVKVEQIMKLGIARGDIFFIHFDGNPRARF